MPLPVTVPVLTSAADANDPAPAAIPSSFALSADDIDPAALVEAAAIEITGVAPPVDAIGAEPVTPMTVPFGSALISAAILDARSAKRWARVAMD